ncbi:Com family DNA-binding transcriptional regulator [Gallibacterium anatis]
MQNKMKDLRCNCCKKLLARTKDNQYLYLEIKCTRCKTLNVFNRNKN